jgi:3-oxoacyl-[acyl-carrier-protein] synthase-1
VSEFTGSPGTFTGTLTGNRETHFEPLPIANFTLTTALGRGREAQVLGGESGLRRCDFPGAEHIDTWIGRVEGVEDVTLPDDLQSYDCRNHRLAYLGLQQDSFLKSVDGAIERHGADRVGVIVGTSTSGIEETERAYTQLASGNLQMPDWYNYYQTHNIGSLVRFTAAVTGAQGYSLAVSTACSSSNKVFASAARALQFNLCDAVVVGGVDTLCLTTLCGFTSLQLTSQQPCRPCDQQRDGISIGEAAGFALLEWSEVTTDGAQGFLLGYGESADAHHMSSPHPEGKGAFMAMQQATAMGGVSPKDVGYINLHGTGTQANDVSECLAVHNLVGCEVPVSSTKGYFGHTLGAAGIVESLVSVLALQNQRLPENLNLSELDERILATVLAESKQTQAHCALSNSFGFGGNNCSLLLGI